MSENPSSGKSSPIATIATLFAVVVILLWVIGGETGKIISAAVVVSILAVMMIRAELRWRRQKRAKQQEDSD